MPLFYRNVAIPHYTIIMVFLVTGIDQLIKTNKAHYKSVESLRFNVEGTQRTFGWCGFFCCQASQAVIVRKESETEGKLLSPCKISHLKKAELHLNSLLIKT